MYHNHKTKLLIKRSFDSDLIPYYIVAMPGESPAAKKPEGAASRNRKGRKGASQSTRTAKATERDQPPSSTTVPDSSHVENEYEEEEICHICAEPMGKKAYAVAECNHRTCYTCSLRLRALYKRLDCTFCKVCRQYRYPFTKLTRSLRNRNLS